jgi:hypothetical protein
VVRLFAGRGLLRRLVTLANEGDIWHFEGLVQKICISFTVALKSTQAIADLPPLPEAFIVWAYVVLVLNSPRARFCSWFLVHGFSLISV